MSIIYIPGESEPPDKPFATLLQITWSISPGYELNNSSLIINRTKNVQKKIEWTLNLIQITQKVPEKYFKHLEGIKGLYEIRVEVRGWGT